MTNPGNTELMRLRTDLAKQRASNMEKTKELAQHGRQLDPMGLIALRLETFLSLAITDEVSRLSFELAFEHAVAGSLEEMLPEFRRAQLLDGVRPTTSGLFVPGR